MGNEKLEVHLGGLTGKELAKKFPEVSGFEQRREVIRNFISGELYAGPMGPLVIKVDPLTTKERAIEIEAWFKSAWKADTDVVVTAMESRYGK